MPLWYGGRPRPTGPGHIVLNSDPAPLPSKWAQPPIFGQRAGWINLPLGSEVGLGPNDIVLDGDPAPLPKKGHSTPYFRPIAHLSNC